MNDFFARTGPVKKIKKEGVEYELPILYHRDDTMMAFFTADAERVRDFLPSPNLHPVMIGSRRCILAMAVFNYLHTTIGPYGEWAFSIPVCFKKRPRTPLPAVLQSWDPSFLLWIAHIPVSTQAALKAGRAEWGYPKFIGDFAFENNPEYLECKLTEGQRRIFDFRVRKRGVGIRDTRPLMALLVKDGNLVRSRVESWSVCRQTFDTRGAFLDVYPGHPMSDDWLKLKPSSRPFMTQYLPEHYAILPAGKVIEKDVRDWQGHVFDNDGKDGIHTLSCNGVPVAIM